MSNILCYSPTSKETIVEDMAERVAHHKLLKVEQYDIKNCYALVELAPIARSKYTPHDKIYSHRC